MQALGDLYSIPGATLVHDGMGCTPAALNVPPHHSNLGLSIEGICLSVYLECVKLWVHFLVIL